MPVTRRWWGRAAAVLAGGLAAVLPVVCGCGPSAEPGADKVDIVATTGMIADAARAVAGDRARVTALMGEGVDPHLYKASPGDLRLLGSADVVLYNGLHLEGRLADALEKLGDSRPVIPLGEAIPREQLRFPGQFAGHPDPHVWFEIPLWIRVVEKARDSLAAVDPAGAEAYTAAAAKYTQELAELDGWVRGQIARIPAPARVLVTAHDAFGYFGRAYGVEVMAIQGISTDSEASIRDINALVDVLVARQVPAVFVESSVPPKTIQALVEGCRARGHELRIGGQLYSDAMGRAGTPEGTYIGMVRHNVSTIVGALAGPPGGGAE